MHKQAGLGRAGQQVFIVTGAILIVEATKEDNENLQTDPWHYVFYDALFFSMARCLLAPEPVCCARRAESVLRMPRPCQKARSSSLCGDVNEVSVAWQRWA